MNPELPHDASCERCKELLKIVYELRDHNNALVIANGELLMRTEKLRESQTVAENFLSKAKKYNVYVIED